MSLHIPVRYISGTPVSVGRLYPCTPLCYTHGYDAVRPSDLSVKSFHINSMALQGWVRPESG